MSQAVTMSNNPALDGLSNAYANRQNRENVARDGTKNAYLPAYGGDLQPGLYKAPNDLQNTYADRQDQENVARDGSKIVYLPAYGGDYQPGVYKAPPRRIANPAPLGLCAFALTTFVLSLFNVNARHTSTSNIVVALAYGYGGLIQLLAGMWEMAIGNTFGATALASYGGFWISYAIVETAGGFGIIQAYGTPAELHNALGFYLTGWFIFTTLMLICTLRSTVAFCSLFLFVAGTFLLLSIAQFKLANGHPAEGIQKAAGVFGLIAAFLAWWNAMAGLLDKTNSFFTIPVLHFPWSVKPEEKKL